MKAKSALGDKLFGREVKVAWAGRDKHKRILGEVFVGDCNVNLDMVKHGFAWHFVQYSRDVGYAKAEKEAKDAKRGLWSMTSPVAPWDYRRSKGIEDPNEAKTDLATFTVYLTSSGKKYHAANCKFLAKSKIEARLGDVARTHEPCSVCKPAVLKK